MSYKSHKSKDTEADTAEANLYAEPVVYAESVATPASDAAVTSVPPELLPGTIIETFNGKPILVGDTVALVCTVVAIDPLDAHYGEIQCTPVYPGLGLLFIPNIQAGQVPQSRAFSAPTPEGGPVFGFHPKQLVEYTPIVPPEPPAADTSASDAAVEPVVTPEVTY